MFVLGTAGHVDHGKSVLVHALTGIDPDRLREEKERGMTIDLGFAWLKLPSGREVSIVDVPGHERFVKNMLAGVGGIDLALLVIAADEGVMPQTREHLAILDLLRVEKGIVVITKKDLVDEEWLELLLLEVSEAIRGTTLALAPILTVSAVNGEGLPSLVSTIDYLLESTPPRRDIGRPRLPIDRVFTMKGFGTVVTGTLIDGSLSRGQEVEILPPSLRAHLRGLQTHKRSIATALPGSRVAANLSGVATTELRRGQVITNPGWLTPTRAVDVKLRLLTDLSRPLSHNGVVTFHAGASEVVGKIRLLEKEKLEPGEGGWAQIILAQPIVVVKGDLFVIRSSDETLGGGEIIDPHAKRHRRFQPSVIESLAVREKGTVQEILLTTLKSKEPVELGKLPSLGNISASEAEMAVKALVEEKKVVILGDKGRRPLILSTQGWGHLVEEVKQLVGNYHRQFPLRHGMPKGELNSRLNIPLRNFAAVLQRLLEEGVLAEDEVAVHLPTHRIQLTREQQTAAKNFLDSLAQRPYSPPSEPMPEPELLNRLIKQRQVVKVSEDIVFTASAYDEMVERIIGYIKSQGKITVAETRDLFKTSRKYALALLEYLDQQKVTRRIGDERVLR